MKTKHILNVNVAILEKGETPILPKNVVKYTIICEEQYMNEYLKTFINVNFSKEERLIIMHIDPNRHDETTGKIYDIILKISGVTKEQIRGKSRAYPNIFMRQLFHYAFMKVGIGTQELAGAETNNSHATVINSLNIINNCIDVGNGKRKAMYLYFMQELKKENILK